MKRRQRSIGIVSTKARHIERMRNDFQKLTSWRGTRQGHQRAIFAICMGCVVYIRFTYCPAECPAGKETTVCGVIATVETLLVRFSH